MLTPEFHADRSISVPPVHLRYIAVYYGARDKIGPQRRRRTRSLLNIFPDLVAYQVTTHFRLNGYGGRVNDKAAGGLFITLPIAQLSGMPAILWGLVFYATEVYTGARRAAARMPSLNLSSFYSNIP